MKLIIFILVTITNFNRNEAFQVSNPTHQQYSRRNNNNGIRTKSLSTLPLPENEASSYNDAFLDTLENSGGTTTNKSGLNNARSLLTGDDESNIDSSNIDPSPDSLAALRDIATTNVANFLATFSQPPEGSIESGENMAFTYENNSGGNNMNQSGSNIDPVTGIPSISPNDNIQEPKKIHWDVYVCQSKQCLERGASATLDSFQALVPTEPISESEKTSTDGGRNLYKSNTVTTIDIHPAILSRSKAKGPNVRCIQRTPPYTSFEVNNVNDIDKVYRILTKHMSIINISKQAKECLKYTYQGNSHLEKNELSDAIRSYNTALEQDYKSQEGMLLLLRATAYLKRAFQHQEILRQTVADLGETVADPMVSSITLYSNSKFLSIMFQHKPICLFVGLG